MNQFNIIENILNALETNQEEPFSLEKIANSVAMHSDDLSRIFKKFTGISPQRYFNYSRLSLIKKQVARGVSLLDLTVQHNTSSESRIYDLFVNYEAVTQGEFRNGGESILMTYGLYDGVLGKTFILTTKRGITGIAFGQSEQEFFDDYISRYPFAEFRRDDLHNEAVYQELLNAIDGKRAKCNLLLIGTNFQIKVWEAILTIPRGSTTTYAALSERVGTKGFRAVGNAVGRNPISYFIPCHRVIQGKGFVGGYHWGSARKKILLANEFIEETL